MIFNLINYFIPTHPPTPSPPDQGYRVYVRAVRILLEYILVNNKDCPKSLSALRNG